MHFRTVFLVLSASFSGFVRAEDPGAARIFAGSGQTPDQAELPYLAGQPTGRPAEVALGNPFGVEISGDVVWLTTIDDHCVWKASADGKSITRVAGTGAQGYSGDGGPARQATFNWPHEVRVDQSGNLFIADTRNHVIRYVDAGTGLVSTLTGDGTAGFAGDGELGTNVQFRQPHSVILDGRGGLLIADTQNHRLRRLDLETGIVTTICGNGEPKMPADGAPAKGSPLFGPRSLAVDDQSIWIALREGNSVWRIDRERNTLHHVAGTGKKGYSGDGGPPIDATFKGPKGLVLAGDNQLLVVDTENQAVRLIDLNSNHVQTVLGGRSPFVGFPLKRPHGISFRKDIGLIVGDSEHHRVITSHW